MDVFTINTMEEYDLLKKKCLIENPMECGNMWYSYIFFCTYTCAVTFVVLNLVVAVILEGFEDSSLDKELEIVNLAIDTWKKYDPKYKLKLDVAKCELLVDEIENAVLSRDEKKTRDSIQLSNKELDFLSLDKLDLDHDGTLDFVQVVQVCLRQIMLKTIEDPDERLLLIDDIRAIESGVFGEEVISPVASLRNGTSNPNSPERNASSRPGDAQSNAGSQPGAVNQTPQHTSRTQPDPAG